MYYKESDYLIEISSKECLPMFRIALHDEIKDILIENGNRWMTSKRSHFW